MKIATAFIVSLVCFASESLGAPTGVAEAVGERLQHVDGFKMSDDYRKAVVDAVSQAMNDHKKHLELDEAPHSPQNHAAKPQHHSQPEQPLQDTNESQQLSHQTAPNHSPSPTVKHVTTIVHSTIHPPPAAQAPAREEDNFVVTNDLPQPQESPAPAHTAPEPTMTPKSEPKVVVNIYYDNPARKKHLNNAHKPPPKTQKRQKRAAAAAVAWKKWAEHQKAYRPAPRLTHGHNYVRT